jgi:site-specific DNA-cytosine methylase
MAPKVKPTKIADKEGSISAAKESATRSASELINFSFKYLREEHEKFPCFHEDHGYYFELVRRIKAISTLKLIELMTNRSSALRMHPIKWSDTSENSFGIPAEEQIVDTPYQLSLTANEYGRLHGFFISNTFYVVWFDKHHALYSG